ncbi:hypothetical protein TrispH2_006299, partial [Trichoplax sp. H2]
FVASYSFATKYAIIFWVNTHFAKISPRDLPLTSNNVYVIREEIINTICNQLKIVDESSGHILIGGIVGSDKTIVACQSIHEASKKGYFKSNGCYWMNVGDVSNNEQFVQLKILGISLGLKWQESFQFIYEIFACLRSYVRGDYFVFLTH